MKKYVCTLRLCLRRGGRQPRNRHRAGHQVGSGPEDWVCPLCGAPKEDLSCKNSVAAMKKYMLRSRVRLRRGRASRGGHRAGHRLEALPEGWVCPLWQRASRDEPAWTPRPQRPVGERALRRPVYRAGGTIRAGDPPGLMNGHDLRQPTALEKARCAQTSPAVARSSISPGRRRCLSNWRNISSRSPGPPRAGIWAISCA